MTGESGRAVRWLTAAWAVALACFCIARNHAWLQDDCFITLRYARHLSEGHGPVWNLAGAPVEGFSSPLHLLLVAGLMRLHVAGVDAARGLGFALHAVLVAFVWRFVRRTSGATAGVLAAALVLSSWPLLLWDLGGLDAVPFGALLAIGTLMTLRYVETGARRDVVWAGFLLGLAVFMRPDGAVVAAVALAACLTLGQQKLSRRVADVLLGAVLCAAAVLPWEIFRVRYFHAYLPNTFYAKIYGVPLGWRVHNGLHYWREFMLKPPYFVPLLVVVVALLLWKRRLSRFDVGLWACMAGYAAYGVASGGDYMPGFRFMVPLVPLFAVALARGVQELGGLRQAYIAAVLMVAMTMQVTVRVLNPQHRDPTAMAGEYVGRYLDAHWRSGSVVALNSAGAIPFYADRLAYIDMLGLNDAAIARRDPAPMDGPWLHLIGHVKGDGASVLARHPDFIILGGVMGSALDFSGPEFVGDYELRRLPGFAALYKPCAVAIPLSDFARAQLKDDIPSPTLWYYQRRDLP